MRLELSGHSFAHEMECIVRIFFAGANINIIKFDENGAGYAVKGYDITDLEVITSCVKPAAKGKLSLAVSVSLGDFEKSASEEIECKDKKLDSKYEDASPTYSNNDACERRLGALLFSLLCEKTGKRPEWGILTGIRPVRLVRRWRASGLTEAQIAARLTTEYLVLPHKAELCIKTANAQDKLLSLNTEDSFSLYVSIPFCPSRCLYCSFVSHEIARAKRLVPDYIELICKELEQTSKTAKALGLRLLTVYVGGGTPTSLEAAGLSRILAAIRDNFDLSGLLEYTVEAGRADTITKEKLEVISGFGADRISINPQSMSGGVLKAVGRGHSPEQVEESLKLARGFNFKAVNMDLIAGLPSETIESFCASLERVIALNPENITVHTLTLKRSSSMREDEAAFSKLNPHAAEMQKHATSRLIDAGYSPYYLYRQKPTAENLENIGFSKPERECVYNIFSMEDTHNILAAGAGGISKLTSGGKKIVRVCNFKYPYEYISRFTEILNRKEAVNEGYY